MIECIHSERRKEYNELADPLFAKVNATVSEAAGHTFGISDLEVAQIRRRMSLLQRLRFDFALANYRKAAKTKVDPIGQMLFTDADAVNLALQRLCSRSRSHVCRSGVTAIATS